MTATLQHSYTPRGACVDAFKHRGAELLLSGPAGTGKSRALLEKLHAMAMLNPGMSGLIVRKVAATLPTTALRTWTKHVVAEAMACGLVDYFGGSQSEAPGYRYSNGGKLDIGGMDKASKIMSSEYDVIYVQEAVELTITDWEALTTRLRNGVMRFQQIMADTNPDRPEHWLKQRADRGQVHMIESRHTDNPLYFTEDGTPTPEGAAYMAVLDGLTGVRRLRLKDGLWVGAEGMIYEEWDSAVHLVPWFEIPREWPRLWSIDFGHTHPFVLQCWAIDPDGRMYRYREIFATKRTVDQHAVTILGLVRTPAPGLQLPDGESADPRKREQWVWTEPEPTAIVCDHDAEGRDTLSTWLGRKTVAANKRIKEGIEAVQRRLRYDDTADGRPRIFLLADATVSRDTLLSEALLPCSTEEEITGYVWDESKDMPVKIRDDGLDAMRYAVMHLDQRKRARADRAFG